MNVVLLVFEDCHAGNCSSCPGRKQDYEGGLLVEYICICEKCRG